MSVAWIAAKSWFTSHRERVAYKIAGGEIASRPSPSEPLMTFDDGPSCPLVGFVLSLASSYRPNSEGSTGVAK